MNEQENTTPQPSGFEQEQAQRVEQCAQLATWRDMENDPAIKAEIEAARLKCIEDAAKAEAKEKAEREAKEAKEKADQKAAERAAEKDAAKAAEKAEQEAIARAEAAAHEAWFKKLDAEAEAERKEAQRNAPQIVSERTIEPPPHIRENPEFQRVVESQRAAQEAAIQERMGRIEAEQRAAVMQSLATRSGHEANELRAEQGHPGQQHENDQAKEGGKDEAAAKELDAQTLKEGQEIEGEIVEVAQVKGQNYYVVEAEEGRVIVPAGKEPEYEAGDEITAAKENGSIEMQEQHSYGR